MKTERVIIGSGTMLAILVGLAACDTGTGPADDVTASLETGGLVITNRTAGTIYYAATSPRSLALIAIGTDPEETPHLAAGATVTMPYADIVGWEGDSEADRVVLYYWRLVPAGGDGWRAEDVHSLEVGG